jgi:hypothetical protein
MSGGFSEAVNGGCTWQEVGSLLLRNCLLPRFRFGNNNTYSGTMGGKIYKSPTAD